MRQYFHRKIVLTRADGGVEIMHPTSECLFLLAQGYWQSQLDEWGMTRAEFAERNRRNMLRSPVMQSRVEIVDRFTRTLAYGGASRKDALGLILAKDRGEGTTGEELWTYDRFPRDRWFRDAWRRHRDGGPIWVDLDAARDVQRARIAQALARNEAKRIELRMDRRKHNQIWDNDPTQAGWRIDQARSPEELKTIWPENLPR